MYVSFLAYLAPHFFFLEAMELHLNTGRPESGHVCRVSGGLVGYPIHVCREVKNTLQRRAPANARQVRLAKGSHIEPLHRGALSTGLGRDHRVVHVEAVNEKADAVCQL